MSFIEPVSPVPPKNTISLLRRIARRVRRRRSAEMDPALVDIAVIEASQRFDKEWYKRRYPDIAVGGVDPVQHYVRHGAAEGRDPSEEFSTAFYLSKNPDVAASGINPFRHYIEHGSSEGRVCRPTVPDKGELDIGHSKERDDRATAQQDIEIIARSALFDTRYYLENYADVLTSGMNPLVHFCRYGFKELRNPSREFDTAWYWLAHLPENITRNPLAHYLRNGSRDGLSIRAVGVFSEDDQQALADAANQLLQSKQVYPAELYERAGIALTRLKRWPGAETAFSMALALEWSNAKVHARLAGVLAQQGKWWQAVESWNAATNLDPSRASWFFRLAEAQEKMNRFALAAEAYQGAIDREPHHSNWYYLLGYMHEMADQQESADKAYAEAVARDPRDSVKAFGIAVFHQDRGYWPEAAVAYARQLESNPASAELRFRLGMAHDRCYRWDKALAAYREAIGLDPSQSYWHYRCGFVLERLECWSEAAEAYDAAAMLSSKPTPYWHYRRGYVLARAGKYKEACLAYIRTYEQRVPSIPGTNPAQSSQTIDGLSKLFERSQVPDEASIARLLAGDLTNASWHYLLGEIRERSEDWAGSAQAYANATARSSSHPAAWHYRLGYVLYRAGRFEDACLAFRETRAFRHAYGVNTEAYAKDREVYANMQYRECLDVLPIQQLAILYESTHGASVGGNPYAIFAYLLDHPNYSEWTHIWAIASGVVIPAELRSRPNVIFVEHSSHLYRRYLATASHLVNDSTFPYWFSRRKEQKYLNTWHGTPLKTLGKPIRAEEEFLSHRNVQRNLLHATHLISPNRHTSDVLMNDFDVRGICAAKLAETGYPRIDRTLNATPERIARVREQLGLEHGKPVVLYAPTWRGIFGQTQVDLDRLREDIKKLTALPCQWVFRGHPFSETLLRDAGLPVAIASSEFDAADVLAVTDVLVTDYSSIFFDFLPTGRQIFLYCYDLNEYATSRGLYFNIYDMPGTVCLDIDALVRGVGRQLAQGDAGAGLYEAAMREFCPHEDGCATARTVDFFFNDDERHAVTRYKDNRRSLLFFGGHFAPNGINSSFLNLMQALQDLGHHHLTVAVEPHRIKHDPIWLKGFRKLPMETVVLGKVGRMVQDPDQAWTASKFRERRAFASPVMHDILQSAYRDEYRRCFGDARIDVLVDFDGYNGYWAMLFGMGCTDQRNYCWLHNDIWEEFLVRYPNLSTQFALYNSYDGLISVSERMEQVNREKLATRFHIPVLRFGHCVNVINRVDIQKRANRPLDQDLVPWFDKGITFLTMGRMSPEKDHAKLIDAFARVHAKHPETKLVILGDGPLRLTLEQQIKHHGLGDVVCLAGQRPNPFPALRRCDCFVLSSNHEGQPMVLLEAMVLDRPIIATDIDGNRGVLGDVYGHLLENSIDSLVDGMLRFLQGQLVFRTFDADAYCAEAIREFDAVVSQ